eukprot:TRINITY_DN1533_c0_g1_i5.p1 TRINITY_DN1533_c0_g1~~TRINITY_DN1533_c0_g1_i5.p1  ORF type:complete len:730 (+),score=159.63 TRINITY_DN1533_c0_g1_i5:296-2485(+)
MSTDPPIRPSKLKEKKDVVRHGAKKPMSNVTITMSDFQQFEMKNKEAEARDWIERVIGESLPTDFHEALHDGVALCKLVNVMFPGAITRYNKPSSYAFKLIENISMFLAVAQKMGVTDGDLFQATDLFENKNMPKVIKCLQSMARVAAEKGFAIKWEKAQAAKEQANPINQEGKGGKALSVDVSKIDLHAQAHTSTLWTTPPMAPVKEPEPELPKDPETEELNSLISSVEKLVVDSKEKMNTLHMACKRGIPRLVDHFVNTKSQPVDALSSQGWSALHFAVQDGNEHNVIKLIDDGGAFVDPMNSEGNTPLHLASFAGNEKIVKILLERGVSVHSVNREGNTALHLACQGGYEIVVRLLVEGGAMVNAVNKEKSTPLHYASLAGNDALVDYLIANGGNVNATNTAGNTSLHNATLRGHKNIVDKLIVSGSDINAVNNENATPLHVATDANFLEVVEVLAESGANVDTQRTDGWTPLYSAAYNGTVDTCAFLLNKHADPNSQNVDLWTPLHAACTNGHKDVVELLVGKYKAKVNIQSKQGTTPLFHAASEGHLDIVEFLLEHGADKELSKDRGWKPIHIACYNDHDNVARVLVEAGVNLDPINDEIKGYAPLHILIAAEKPSLELLELFLQKGADLNKKNSNGSTPLHLAVFWGHMFVVQLLIQYGADLGVENNKGRTALDLSCHYGNEEMAKFLARRMGKDENKLRIKKNKQKLMDMNAPKAPPVPEND